MKIKNIILKKKFQFILFPLLLILSACGGGGSGGGAGSSTTRSIAACTDSGTAFQTTEYLAMGGGTTGRKRVRGFRVPGSVLYGSARTAALFHTLGAIKLPACGPACSGPAP